ncbi:hypothetical protein BH09PLA1_BH09PLA1_13660 [soil metagenome]
MTLKESIGKRGPFNSLEEHAYLALRRATWNVTTKVAAVYESGGFTASQYNVLRILRGHHPVRLTASNIGSMMVSRDSDLTRILTDLQKRRLVSRSRCTKDRRHVWVDITEHGLANLKALDEPVVAAIRSAFDLLDAEKLGELTRLLEPLCDRQPEST